MNNILTREIKEISLVYPLILFSWREDEHLYAVYVLNNLQTDHILNLHIMF